MTQTSKSSMERQESQGPEDDDLSPIRPQFDFRGNNPYEESFISHTKSTLDPVPRNNSTRAAPGEDGRGSLEGETSVLEEQEMRRRLMDMDSSFSPLLSPTGRPSGSGVDDTFVFGGVHSPENAVVASDEHSTDRDFESMITARTGFKDEDTQESPMTPPGMYQTPAPDREMLAKMDGPNPALDGDHDYTSSLETMSSSPTTAAAARTVSRVLSMASTGGYETANDASHVITEEGKVSDSDATDDPTPQRLVLTTIPSPPDSPTPTKLTFSHGGVDISNGNIDENDFGTPRSRKRPKFLKSRMASQRSSNSSYTTVSTEGGSDVTVGADYALQSGGAAPFGGSVRSRPSADLSRTTSLGSMASGVSEISDGEDILRSATGLLEGNLSTLDEEDFLPNGEMTRDDDSAPETPRGTSRSLNTPTETVISQHVRDVEVPATMAREYRHRHRPPSPEKRNGAPTPSIGRHGKNLTLKEQSSTIDRLMKENWDLKLKISFLNDALNRRSDEGVKAIISENVELRTAKFQSMTEIRELKRSIRELERKLKERSDQLADSIKDVRLESEGDSQEPNDQQELDEKVTYLTDRIMTYEIEIERMRHESTTQEGERRRLAEVLKKVGERREPESDIGAREEMDMWKDLLEAETARREQADEENRKLREELWRRKSDTSTTTTNNATDMYHITKRHQTSSLTHTESSDRGGGLDSAASSTLVEQLRHENAELRREVGAQTSMLTSRNREKERLYQEIEELKLGARRGDTRSVVGDSIFERSASRAHGRSASRASDMTKVTQISDAEREALEIKNGELRDQINESKLLNQALERHIGVLLDELEQSDTMKADYVKLQQIYDEDVEGATEDLQRMQSERDEALKYQEVIEGDMQDLKEEAQERLNALEEELNRKTQDLQRSHEENADLGEQSDALAKEIRSLQDRMQRAQEDMRSKVKKIQDLGIEIEAINRENEIIDKDYHEEKDKNARLTIQQESSQNEIAFLREEQDGDKIKIGDLEDHVNNLKASLSSEKDRCRDLDSRLAEERHQREIIGGKEKQEVQKMINDLNREASGAQEESRKLKKSLQASEIDATTFKERLMELESNLREALGDANGTRSSFLTSITKLQKELEITKTELDVSKNTLSDRERLLKNRDELLESHGLESKKLSELLDRERQGRRTDKAQHDQWQRTHQHTSRTVTQKDTRITELESGRQSDRKKLLALEQQFKDQLAERNNLLLTLWNRISTMCGSDWQHQNTLVNNHLPTVEVVANMLPSFCKSLLNAVKTVEGMLLDFKGRVRTIERDLWKSYQSLESNLESRIKKLDRLEAIVQSQRVSGTLTAAPEIAKLSGENRLLKSQLAVFQKKELHARAASRTASNSMSGSARESSERAAPAPTLMRHHSSSAVETLERRSSLHPQSTSAAAALIPRSAPIETSEQRWMHRLRELERRLKAEREARLLDRSGARKRLEEGRAETAELKMELERERARRGGSL
ncbi:Anucleate primary sterigmata protein B [Pseudocyphellaria aurata]|nr:Anucleate primary sterigmata protein B [Pseudocyphellaria aurata]